MLLIKTPPQKHVVVLYIENNLSKIYQFSLSNEQWSLDLLNMINPWWKKIQSYEKCEPKKYCLTFHVKEWWSDWHFRKSTNTVITIGEIQVAKIWASCGIGGIAEAWAKSSCKLRSNFLLLDQPIKPRVVMMMMMTYWWWLWWLWLCWQWWKNNYSWLGLAGWLFVCSIFMPDNVDKNIVVDNDHNLDDDHDAFKRQNLFSLLPSR